MIPKSRMVLQEGIEAICNHRILTPQVFQAHRLTVMDEPFLLAEGILQKAEGTVALKAEAPLPLGAPALGIGSHDFR